MRIALIILLSGILIAVVIGFVQFFSEGSNSNPISITQGPSSDGGLYRSDDGGEKFALFSDTPEGIDLSKLDVTSLIEDPVEAGTWWISTAGGGLFVWDSDAVPDSQEGDEGDAEGLSPDKLWLPVWGQDDVLKDSNIRAFARAGSDGVLITLDAEGRGRIWKSTDFAAGFRETYSTAENKVYVTALTVAPTNSNNVLAGLSDGLVIGSSDGGETWTALQEFGENVNTLQFTQTDENVVYGNLISSGAIRSFDGGKTFEKLSKIRLPKDDPQKDAQLSKFNGSRTVSSFGLNPYDASHILLATAGGLLRSRDSGTHWELLPVPILPEALPARAAAFEPTNPSILHVTAGDGFYTSFDDGANWRVTRFTINPELSRVAVSRENPNLILIGTTDN